jgi:hypothetical protein
MRPTLSEVLTYAEVLVITNRDSEFSHIADLVRPGQLIVDFARVVPDRSELGGAYLGICWWTQHRGF